MSKKRVAVLGCTGSIGTQTLQVLEKLEDTHELVCIAGGKKLDLIEEQKNKFGLSSENAISAFDDVDALHEFASRSDVDIVINGVVGFAGFKVTLAALKANKILGLANKESLIAGGPIVKKIIESPGFSGSIIPVDSEHSAIWQCLKSGESGEVDEIVLTASGGPFRGMDKEDLKKVTKQQALNHPTWNMGPKITIDSATLMNKGLEVIEAHELFNIDFDRIKVVVHPQSIVHSMVTYVDGATIAQLSYPDMRLPISLALGASQRLNVTYGKIDFTETMELNFEKPDFVAFPALQLAYSAGRAGGGAPATLSAANEVAVEAFLDEKIEFCDITDIVNEVLNEGTISVDKEDDVYEADRIGRERAARYIEKKLM
ncbi:MAG: 1-deoxy-D-xylulose-5-phosphate reductoisomerase [Acidimicrobiia bacterium]